MGKRYRRMAGQFFVIFGKKIAILMLLLYRIFTVLSPDNIRR